MNLKRLTAALALPFLLAACGPVTSGEEQCIEDCGDGCPAPEFQPCASDGNTYCNGCVIECKGLTVADDASTCEGEDDDPLEKCFEDCGVGCPAPEFWVCASDGKRYCNECVIGCRDLQVADDAATCETDTEEACIEGCGEGCVAPEFQPCASDGQRYCNECVIACKELTVADDAATCGE